MLGRLLERRQPGEVQRPDRPTLSAFLVLSANAPVLEGVWQVHPYFGMGVQQHPLEHEVHGVRLPGPSRYPSSGALEPVTPEQMAGVPRAVQLTIRSDDRRNWLPRQISLREIRFRPDDIEMATRDVPHEALANGSIWFVFTAFDSDAAPST